jgi:hypothetical protein
MLAIRSVAAERKSTSRGAKTPLRLAIAILLE